MMYELFHFIIIIFDFQCIMYGLFWVDECDALDLIYTSPPNSTVVALSFKLVNKEDGQYPTMFPDPYSSHQFPVF